MGAPLQSLLSLDLKGMVPEYKGMRESSNGSLWSKVLRGQSTRRRLARKQRFNGRHGWSRRPSRTLMKRRAISGGCKRPKNGIGRRVRTLKKLIPNGKSTGLDGLFRDTADYILYLQMRVKAMQIMVNVFSSSDEN
ncbi:hypothetical protein HHK36_026325 [Tetracentron sinense]|uniref:Uncharacterized protein n=1 Tax=Tetracentron sinense TaxID=13715 RepID=A0A834YIH7_TETSI|nr:hypothetical protein HHK36_026325 [Tetracentron sinense]